MKTPLEWIKGTLKGIDTILFPDICMSCGIRKTSRQLCQYCMDHRFPPANPDHNKVTGDTLLPDGIAFQYALWKFDKSGALQNLLHRLKYQHLRKIGLQMGCQLGVKLKKYPYYQHIADSNPLLVPVPLHRVRLHKRGYNQAAVIARGIRETLNVQMLNEKALTRRRNTRTQTGFSMQKRLKNVSQAFKVQQPAMLEKRTLIIVDDVFTTGATTFELARELLNYKPQQVGICTVAQA